MVSQDHVSIPYCDLMGPSFVPSAELAKFCAFVVRSLFEENPPASSQGTDATQVAQLPGFIVRFACYTIRIDKTCSDRATIQHNTAVLTVSCSAPESHCIPRPNLAPTSEDAIPLSARYRFLPAPPLFGLSHAG